MREILFRGKRKDNGIWITGVYHPAGGRHLIFPLPIIPPKIEVDPATVGQFTGYCDKAGKRVFEGDVVKYYDIIVKKELTSCVEWWEDGFILQEIGGFNGPSMCLVFEESQVEIIGNIHDNPELLKEGEDDG